MAIRGGTSVCRPVSGRFETAKLTHQVRKQGAERPAFRDRVPLAALADTPPIAARARGDLPRSASPERAPAPHAPSRRERLVGRQALNGLVEGTHGESCDYPAWALACLPLECLCRRVLPLFEWGGLTIRSGRQDRMPTGPKAHPAAWVIADGQLRSRKARRPARRWPASGWRLRQVYRRLLSKPRPVAGHHRWAAGAGSAGRALPADLRGLVLKGN